jgi:uncharacterized protein YqeY
MISMGDVRAMTIGEKIQADIVVAMKARDEHKLTTLRMVKSALKNKEIDKREKLTDAEESQILTTLIKQRKESVESFTKGNRPELAEKEQVEIGMIEGYLPQAVGEDVIRGVVRGAIDTLTNDGAKPGPKDMGTLMKVVQQRILADGVRADGKLVSEIVKAELAK